MTASASTIQVPDEVTAEGPRRTLTALRIAAVLHSLAILVQPVLAGIYLSGDVDAIRAHAINADVTASLGVIQLIAAIVFVWKGRGRQWAIWSALGISLAEQIQIPLGMDGALAVHLPLGVSIVALQILLTVWVFRSDARLPRAPRRPR